MGIDNTIVPETALSGANVRVREFDVNRVREVAADHGLDFDGLDDESKCGVLTDMAAESEQWAHNITCIGLDEYRAENLATTETANEDIARLAVGRGTTAPEHANRMLNDEIGRTGTASQEVAGPSILVGVLLGAGEFNGEDITEVGLYSTGDRLLNHSLINSIQKTDQKNVTVEVRLTFDTA